MLTTAATISMKREPATEQMSADSDRSPSDEERKRPNPGIESYPHHQLPISDTEKFAHGQIPPDPDHACTDAERAIIVRADAGWSSPAGPADMVL